MEHKAYIFDWAAFERELAPLLLAALRTGKCEKLEAFIDTHREDLTDPNEGDPLPDDWRTLVETWDAHQLGDLALTKYYDAGDVDGLGYDWEELDERAPPAIAAAVLGEPFGPTKNPFDPGKYGSYFQTLERVRKSLAAMARVRWPELRPYRAILKAAARRGRGVYVTF